MVDWLQNHADYDMRVIFCCLDARTAQAYQRKMKMEKTFKSREIADGIFLDRPNRFIAHVDVNGAVETVHVKNTGR